MSIRGLTLTEGCIPVGVGRIAAQLAVALRGTAGRVQLVVTECGRRNAQYTAGVVIGDSDRRDLIRALGGIPADEVPGEDPPGSRCWFCGDQIAETLTAVPGGEDRAPMHGTCPRNLP